MMVLLADLAGILSPITRPLTTVLEWLHGSVGISWAWSIVVLTVHGADRPRSADGQADPVDAEAAAVRPAAEGDPAEVQGRQAAH